MKICVLGCGLRTPLLLHGLLHSELAVSDVALFDIDSARAQLMTDIGTLMGNGDTRIHAFPVIEKAIGGFIER